MSLAPRCLDLADNSDCVMLDSDSIGWEVTRVFPDDSSGPQSKG